MEKSCMHVIDVEVLYTYTVECTLVLQCINCSMCNDYLMHCYWGMCDEFHPDSYSDPKLQKNTVVFAYSRHMFTELQTEI